MARAAATIGPSDAASYYLDRFSMACVRHQRCYRDGLSTYGLTRKQCDAVFQDDMKKSCAAVAFGASMLASGITSAGCTAAADVLHAAAHDLGARRYQSAAGAKCYYDRHDTTAKVRVVEPDGRIGQVQHGYMAASGWWVAARYDGTAASDNLLLLDPVSGRVELRRPIENGAVASKIDSQEWGSGWTTAKGFRVGGKSFLLLLGADTGLVAIHRVSADGRIGARIGKYGTLGRFTSAEFYEAGGKTYLLLVNGQDLHARYLLNMIGAPSRGRRGIARVHEMNRDGTIGRQVRQYDLAGWSVARTIEVGGVSYMLFLKTADGSVRIDSIAGDGTLGPKVYEGNWLPGSSVVEPYETGGRTFAFVMTSDGRAARVYELKSVGSFASIVTEYQWSEGWTSATFFRSKGRLYALFMTAVDQDR
jgi:hypothetical protein